MLLSSTLEPWKKLYSSSPVFSAVLLCVHLASLMIAGGFALSRDRQLLMTARPNSDWDKAEHRMECEAVSMLIWRALVVTMTSGLLLLSADLVAFVSTPVLWIKFALVVALFINLRSRCALELRASRAIAHETGNNLWSRMRTHARVDVALWLLTLLAGTTLTVA